MITQKQTQCKQILDHMEMYGSIEPLEALEKIGCFRLGARIHDLRKKGYIIETDIIHKNGKQYAKYILRGHANDLSVR